MLHNGKWTECPPNKLMRKSSPTNSNSYGWYKQNCKSIVKKEDLAPHLFSIFTRLYHRIDRKGLISEKKPFSEIKLSLECCKPWTSNK